jgi:hypothetical protein
VGGIDRFWGRFWARFWTRFWISVAAVDLF